jgi:hypothetical protein
MFSSLVNDDIPYFDALPPRHFCSMSEIIRIVKEWFSRDHTRFVLGIGIFSAGLAGYSLGILREKSMIEIPLVMNIVPPQESVSPQVLGDTAKEPLPAVKVKEQAIIPEGKCAFVGSKNSTLYHLPTCAPAKRIKETNRVCFASKEAAEVKGYKPGCLK